MDKQVFVAAMLRHRVRPHQRIAMKRQKCAVKCIIGMDMCCLYCCGKTSFLNKLGSPQDDSHGRLFIGTRAGSDCRMKLTLAWFVNAL